MKKLIQSIKDYAVAIPYFIALIFVACLILIEVKKQNILNFEIAFVVITLLVINTVAVIIISLKVEKNCKTIEEAKNTQEQVDKKLNTLANAILNTSSNLSVVNDLLHVSFKLDNIKSENLKDRLSDIEKNKSETNT